MKLINRDAITGVATIVDEPMYEYLDEGFLDVAHYVPRTLEEIADILGGTLKEDDEGDGVFYISVPGARRIDVISAQRMKVEGGPHSILRLAPGAYRGELYDAIVETFGDTRLPQPLVDALIAELGAKGVLGMRRVLVADPDGTDAVTIEQGMDSIYVLSADLANTDTPVAFTLRGFDGAMPMDALPETGTRLAIREYPTVEDFAGAGVDNVLGLYEHCIESLLERAGVGIADIHAVLTGPLQGSQSVMLNDYPRHVAEPGFVGQFRPAGKWVAFNYMVSNVDGTFTLEPNAL